MNGAAQRQHTTRTAQLTSDLETVEGLLHETARRVKRQDDELQTEYAARIAMSRDQRTYIDAQDREGHERFARFVGRGFWSRIDWLLTGR